MKRLLLLIAMLCSAACADLHNASESASQGDYAAAVPQWQRLAAADFPEAQTRLARCYLRGDGVPQEPAKAVPLLQRATELGYAPAYQDLGQLYEKGIGLKQDAAKAEAAYRQSAELGNGRAYLALGRLYRKQKDEARAQSAFALAAKSGYPFVSDMPVKEIACLYKFR